MQPDATCKKKSFALHSEAPSVERWLIASPAISLDLNSPQIVMSLPRTWAKWIRICFRVLLSLSLSTVWMVFYEHSGDFFAISSPRAAPLKPSSASDFLLTREISALFLPSAPQLCLLQILFLRSKHDFLLSITTWNDFFCCCCRWRGFLCGFSWTVN
jgi:hypothetical protein